MPDTSTRMPEGSVRVTSKLAFSGLGVPLMRAQTADLGRQRREDAHGAGCDGHPDFAFGCIGQQGEAPASADVVKRRMQREVSVSHGMGGQGERRQPSPFAKGRVRGAPASAGRRRCGLPARRAGPCRRARFAIWAAGGDGGEVERAGTAGQRGETSASTASAQPAVRGCGPPADSRRPFAGQRHAQVAGRRIPAGSGRKTVRPVRVKVARGRGRTAPRPRFRAMRRRAGWRCHPSGGDRPSPIARRRAWWRSARRRLAPCVPGSAGREAALGGAVTLRLAAASAAMPMPDQMPQSMAVTGSCRRARAAKAFRYSLAAT
jgi:hypothetical protein